ncbi:MAG: zinc-dependent alcohol dehydrogenase family protein [Smithellaceae bacterium]
MKALIYLGPGKISWEEKQKPALVQGTDAIVKIIKTTICGTDLHILKGDVPSVQPGRILGHEGIGIVEAVGASVSNFRVGDRVLIACITADGKCPYCKIGMYSHCLNGGWILGNTIDGTQAEYVRIPYADTSLYLIPQGVDEEAVVMLSDVLPTGYECGILKSKVEPGDTIAIVGAGPIGFAALLTAQLYSPERIVVIDVNDYRLELAKEFGATAVINSTQEDAVRKVMDLTGQKGVDAVIEAVGIPATFDLCQSVVAPGGRIANIGVHGKSVNLHLERLWSHNITLTTRLVDTISIPLLMRIITSERICPQELISHHFKLTEIEKAYTAFGNAQAEKAMKVILSNV